MKLIRALVAEAGQRLDRVTAGDPTHEFADAPTTAWYFLTDQGLLHIVDAGGNAISSAAARPPIASARSTRRERRGARPIGERRIDYRRY